MSIEFDLDHVAVAAERQADVWPRYAGDLAGAWVGGGAVPGFDSAQVKYANGMKVEALEPFQPEINDFLRRFLDHRGPGVHHLTFKTGDIVAALEAAEAAGYRPVGVNLSDPMWKEAFLHPKDAPGIVVQMAQSDWTGEWSSPRPDHIPAPRTAAPATLLRVVHAVADGDEAMALFTGLLGGTTVAEEDGWIELGWKGPGRIRLLLDRSDYLNGERGRAHHLAFATEAPDGIAHAKQDAEGIFWVEPEDNHGVRLRIETHGYAGSHGRNL